MNINTGRRKLDVLQKWQLLAMAIIIAYQN